MYIGVHVLALFQTPCLLILSFKSTHNIYFMRKFVFVLGGSSVSSAIDDNLDVFNEKMGQIHGFLY